MYVKLLLVVHSILAPSVRVLGCELCAPSRVEDGPVFELSSESIDAAAERHDLLLLLLYDGRDEGRPTKNSKAALGTTAGRLQKALEDEYLDPALISADARRAASLSTAVDAKHRSLMVAQLDASLHPLAADRLGVHRIELPALRFVRGDASYGYKIRAPAGDFVTRTGTAVLDELNAPRALARPLLRTEPPDAAAPPLRLVATIHSAQSLCALQLVAHAYRKADEPSDWPPIAFALNADSTTDPNACRLPALAPADVARAREPALPAARVPSSPPSVRTPSSLPDARADPAPPSPTALRPSAARPPPPRPAKAECIVLQRRPPAAPSTPFATRAADEWEPPTLEMPLGAMRPFGAKALHAWVHWAALPKVAVLDGSAATAATFMREGDVRTQLS